jgi:uncharacterized protein YchJ
MNAATIMMRSRLTIAIIHKTNPKISQIVPSCHTLVGKIDKPTPATSPKQPAVISQEM